MAPPLGLTAAGINALNSHSLATEGYEPSGYWAFFNETGAGRVLDAHVIFSIQAHRGKSNGLIAIQQDSFWSVMYTDNDPMYWKTVYGPTGALDAFVEADKMAPTGGFVSDNVSCPSPFQLEMRNPKQSKFFPSCRTEKSTISSSQPNGAATIPASTIIGLYTAT